MTIKAKCGVELNGHIYSKGETCEFGGIIDGRIAANFVTMDGEPLVVASTKEIEEAKKEESEVPPADNAKDKISKAVSVMGRKGIMQQLETMGITFSPNAKTDYLAKLMLMNKGEIVEGE